MLMDTGKFKTEKNSKAGAEKMIICLPVRLLVGNFTIRFIRHYFEFEASVDCSSE